MAQTDRIVVDLALPTANDALFSGNGPGFYQYVARNFKGVKSTPSFTPASMKESTSNRYGATPATNRSMKCAPLRTAKSCTRMSCRATQITGITS
jgi:hypothetical protein